MRTPGRRVVRVQDLNVGDYIGAERKRRDWMRGPDYRQGRVEKVVPGYGVVITDERFIAEDAGFTVVLLESQAERDEKLRRVSHDNPDTEAAGP